MLERAILLHTKQQNQAPIPPGLRYAGLGNTLRGCKVVAPSGLVDPMNRVKLALCSLLLAAGAAHGQGAAVRIPSENRPPGMALLFERTIPGGPQALGVYAITPDPAEPGLKRIKVWEELPNDVKVRSETIRCSIAAPTRVTNDGRHLILRELNPGGAISSANRIDHLVWWAACFPEQAGKDPAGLRPLALQLGYSGFRVERELVLPGGLR
jgi:hypothetical protein